MRARRSCLSAPAHPDRKLAKAAELAPDEVIVDLEDSVPAALKPAARAAVVAALASAEWNAPTVSVRVNGSATPWFEDDLRALAGAGDRLDTVILPKVETAAELVACAGALAELGRDASRAEPIGLQALIETAAGLVAVNEIAAATPELETLILGPADLSVSLGFPSPDEGSRWDFVRGAIVVAARAAGVQAIDGPFLRIADLDGLERSAATAREFGFDGKWALHPAQIEPLERAFSPSAEELAGAEAILAALDGSAAGAAMLDGEMVDEASRKRALRVLARARR